MTALLVEGPGWVDRSTRFTAGFFPLAVEQHLQSAVAACAPGVTTVTSIARYYALHALVAHEAEARRLDEVAWRALLRRAEVVYGLICLAHEQTSDHDRMMPAPHGRDRLRNAVRQGAVSLDMASGMGKGRYANDRIGFLRPYWASEQTLGLLSTSGFAAGNRYDDRIVRGELGAVLELASRGGSLTLADLAGFGSLCLCNARTSRDGELLARLFAGRPDDDRQTVARDIGQLMRLLAAAMEHSDVSGDAPVDDLGRFVMYDPRVTTDPLATDHWLRWRGIRLRAESVAAWRRLFALLCGYLSDGDVWTVDDIGDRFASRLPRESLAAFLGGLPSVRAPDGTPLRAESEVLGREHEEERELAMILLGGLRYQSLADGRVAERRGFVGHRDPHLEELSPAWVSDHMNERASSSVGDFARWLARAMINRAHRISLAKSSWSASGGRFTIPGRLRLDDEVVTRVNDATASLPALRWRQMLSMGLQTGIFDVVDGYWKVGSRGGSLR